MPSAYQLEQVFDSFLELLNVEVAIRSVSIALIKTTTSPINSRFYQCFTAKTSLTLPSTGLMRRSKAIQMQWPYKLA